MNTHTINSETTLKFAQENLAKLFNEKKWLQIIYNFDQGRTTKQNSALHVYLKLLADALNEAGHGFYVTINKKETECVWTAHSVKDFLWRPVQKAITHKESTTKLSRKEVSEVYEVLNRHTAEKLGVHVPFPERLEK